MLPYMMTEEDKEIKEAMSDLEEWANIIIWNQSI